MKVRTTSTPAIDAILVSKYLEMPVKALAVYVGKSHCFVVARLRQLGLIIPPEIIAQRKVDSQIKKGHVPKNKGKRQTEYMSHDAIAKAKVTQFKKGHLPHNTKEKNGTISRRVDKSGRVYNWVRVSIGKWEMLHVQEWETAHGPTPKGMVIIFKDKNTNNCQLSNLECISKAENMRRNTIHRYPVEIKKAIKHISKLNKKIDNAQKQDNRP